MRDWRSEAFIHIIESPSDKDMLNGRTEGRALASALELSNIQYCYNLVTTQETLNMAITDRLVNTMLEKKKWPILHLSMHGDTRGIALTDNSVIQWYQLCQKIIPIRNSLKQYSSDLLVCMSCCYGSFASQMATVKEGEIPFDFLVGNSDAIPWSEAAVAYITFYHLFFKGFDIQKCIEIMRAASANNKFEIYNGKQVHFNWIQYNQHIAAEISRQFAQEAIRQQAFY